MTTLIREGDDSKALLDLLREAASNRVDVARWLGHGRSSIGGRTPLMEAAMQGRTACCAVLADAARARDRGLNARNERGRYSALHYACYHGVEGDVSIGTSSCSARTQAIQNNSTHSRRILVSDVSPSNAPRDGAAQPEVDSV